MEYKYYICRGTEHNPTKLIGTVRVCATCFEIDRDNPEGIWDCTEIRTENTETVVNTKRCFDCAGLLYEE